MRDEGFKGHEMKEGQLSGVRLNIYQSSRELG
jgi:hypothetical protein